MFSEFVTPEFKRPEQQYYGLPHNTYNSNRHPPLDSASLYIPNHLESCPVGQKCTYGSNNFPCICKCDDNKDCT